MKQTEQIRSLLNRLARLDAGEGWAGDLNPAQRDALDYLARANRFSRSPSHVAEYLDTTRGTMSQTLKALVRKGYLSEKRSIMDKRVVSFTLTDQGQKATSDINIINRGLDDLDISDRKGLHKGLTDLLESVLKKSGGKTFGICHTCRHFSKESQGGFCNLLSEPLTELETKQICHEQDSA